MLKPKTTFNKTVCLPEALFARWQAFACFTGESFNGYVVKHLDATLPHLDAQKEAQP
jgi:hypothetical protein